MIPLDIYEQKKPKRQHVKKEFDMTQYAAINELPEAINVKYDVLVMKRLLNKIRNGSITEEPNYTCDQLIELFDQYLNDLSANPMLIRDYVGKDAKEVNRQKPRPPSLRGFTTWLGFTHTNFLKYRVKQDNSNTPIANILNAIDDACRNSMIEGAANYTYNPNLVARLYGLIDKQETTVKFELDYSKMSTKELNERVNLQKAIKKHTISDDAQDATIINE